MSDNVFTDANFDDEVVKSDLPVLVDFYADWCGPCKMVSPLVDEVAREFSGKLKVGKLDVDVNAGVAAKFGIMSIPTFLFFKGGQMVSTLIGFRPKEVIVAEVNKLLS